MAMWVILINYEYSRYVSECDDITILYKATYICNYYTSIRYLSLF